MKYLVSLLIILSFCDIFIPAAAQNNLYIDPTKIQNNFLNINYFNDIWLKSTDINRDDVAGFTRRASEKIEKGYFEEAYSDIDNAIKIQPDYYYPYLLKGIYFLNRLAIDSAKIAFNKSLKIDSLNTLTMFYLGIASIFSNATDKAEEYFTRITKAGDKQFLGYFGLANLAMINGDFYECRTLMRKTLKVNPEFIQAAFAIGLIDFMELNMNSSDNYMDKVIAQNPGFAPAYFLKGIIKLRNPVKTEEAIIILNKAIELDPDNYSYLDVRATAYKHNNKPEEALNDVLKILQAVCVEKKWISQGSNAINNTQFMDSYFLFKLYKEYKSLFNYENRKMLLEFLWYFYSQDYLNAQKELLKVQLSDDNATLDIFLGLNYEKQGNQISAYEYYQRAIIKSPESYYGYLRTGILSFKQKNYLTAISNLDQALARNDTVTEAYWWRGFSFYSLNKIIDAVKDFNYYLRKDSTDIESRFARASIRIKAEFYESALKDLNILLFYKEDHSEAIKLKADCLYHLDDFKGVTESMEKLKPSLITYEEYMMLGYSYMQIGKYKEATDCLSTYISADRFNLKVYTWRGNCYFSLGDYLAAANDFTKCIYLNSDMGVLYYLRGSTYLKLKKIEAACSDFKLAELKGYKVPIDYKDTCGK
jgi:tetratricopeptide (TPR) repeat protein